MKGKRKRYYHKTICVREILGNHVVLTVMVLFVLGLVVPLVQSMDHLFGRECVMQSYERMFPHRAKPYTAQTARSRFFAMFPAAETANLRRLAQKALEGGTKKEEKKEEPERENTEQIAVRETDMSAKQMQFRNETGYTPDVATLRNRVLSFSDSPKVLIMHTHTSEAYIESEGARTSDDEKNVVRVGEVISETLRSRGVFVIHDTTKNDVPSYNGSYTKAMQGIEAQIKAHPDIQIVLDIHRDYAEQTKDGTTVQLKPTAQVNGEKVAQVMFVVGTDGLGLEHPYWQENLAFAVQMQDALEGVSPRLARPINLRRERFNQHLTRGSLIVEVGTAGNSLAECERAGVYVGNAVADVIQKEPA